VSRLETCVHHDIDEVDPHEWDGILHPRDLQATHGFIRVCRDSRIQDAELRHVCVRDGSGRLEAAASLTRFTVSLELLSPGVVRSIANVVRHARPQFLKVPVIFCGLPVSFGSSSVRFAGGADVNAALSCIARAMEEFAEERRAGLLCWKEFTDEERPMLDGLRRHGYFVAKSLPGCAMSMRWRTFDHYLESMRATYRRQARADLAVRRHARMTVERTENLAAHCDGIHELYEQVMDRALFQMERLPRAFFQRLGMEMGPAAPALLLKSGERLEAMAVLLRADDTLTFLLAGIDYAHGREHHAYQNLVMEVIAEAIRSRASRLVLGQTSYSLKTRLGGIPDPRWMCLRMRRAGWHGVLRSMAPTLFPPTSVPVRRVFHDAPRSRRTTS